MDTDIRKLLEDNFDFAFRAATYNNMRIAIRAFEQFTRNNEDFFSFDKKDTLFGHLRTYAVEKQFNDSAFNPKANYTVSMRQVNRYKYKILCIETRDFILNLGRTNGRYVLLPASLYKKEYAKANSGINAQLSFDFSDGVANVVEGKKYAEITYGYKYGELTHLMILLPNCDYTFSGQYVDLLDNGKVYEGYVPEKQVEESIVTLKKSLKMEIEKV